MTVPVIDDCASATVAALSLPSGVYNVCDDDLPTCSQYLAEYKKYVRNVPVLPTPYSAAVLLSRAVSWYAQFSTYVSGRMFLRPISRKTPNTSRPTRLDIALPPGP